MPEQRDTFTSTRANVHANALYRNPDGVVAGICSAFAQRWGVDTGVLRFAVVAFTLATAGLFALVYVALWLSLPMRDDARHTVDVSPDFVASDHYGVRGGSQSGCKAAASAAKKEKARTDHSHTPPQSPEQAAAAARARFAQMQGRQPAHQAEGPVAVGLGVGVVLAVAGMAVLISSMFPVFRPVQFWPLAIIALGIIRMVVPKLRGYRIESFMLGFALFCVGVVLLANTTGVYFMHFDRWVAQGWPLLAMTLGCGLLWRATRLNGFALCVMLLVAAFCVVGIAFCSEPGPALSVITDQPFTKDFPQMGERPR